MTDAKTSGVREPAAGLMRSKSLAYAMLCVVCATSLGLFLSLFRTLEGVLLSCWSSSDHWYLQQYRPISAWVWHVTEGFSASVGFSFIPGALLVLIGVANVRLPRNYARHLDLGVGIAWVTTVVGGAVNLIHLLML